MTYASKWGFWQRAKYLFVKLPSFKTPPLDEVVCGLRYAPLEQLKVPHIGLLWKLFRNEYPVVQHVPPISSDTMIVVDEASGAPLPRVWFINTTDDQLIQFQVDRTYFNWRRRQAEYPRYSHIIGEFERYFSTLEQFIKENSLGGIQPVEFELTYINHIPKGEGWEEVSNLSGLFNDLNWQGASHKFLPEPTNATWQLRFQLPENNGWLTIKMRQAIRKSDSQPILVLELSAKGLGQDTSKEGMRLWYDLARQWIVRGFEDITSPSAQKTFWKKENVQRRASKRIR